MRPVVEQRTHHLVTGEPMKFLSLAACTGMAETELFAQWYKGYGLATVRYPFFEVEARIERFDNGRGCGLLQMLPLTRARRNERGRERRQGRKGHLAEGTLA